MQSLYFSRAFASMVVLSLTVGGIGSATGCTVVTNTTALQCRSDDDCQSHGLDGYACDLSTHVCQAVAEDKDLCAPTLNPDNTVAKSANQSCIDKFNGDLAICTPRSHKCV